MDSVDMVLEKPLLSISIEVDLLRDNHILDEPIKGEHRFGSVSSK